MPIRVLKTWSEEYDIPLEEAEKCWRRSKKIADKLIKQQDEHYWAYVTYLTKQCLGIDKKEKKG